MEKKQMKKKHRFNLFDVLIIVLVIAVAAAVFWFFNRDKGGTILAAGTKVTYQLEITNVPQEVAYSPRIGDYVKEGVRKVRLGKIVGVDVQPYEKLTRNLIDDTINLTPVPDRYTVVITCEADGKLSGGRVSVNGHVFGVGSEIALQSKNFAGTSSSW